MIKVGTEDRVLFGWYLDSSPMNSIRFIEKRVIGVEGEEKVILWLRD